MTDIPPNKLSFTVSIHTDGSSQCRSHRHCHEQEALIYGCAVRGAILWKGAESGRLRWKTHPVPLQILKSSRKQAVPWGLLPTFSHSFSGCTEAAGDTGDFIFFTGKHFGGKALRKLSTENH